MKLKQDKCNEKNQKIENLDIQQEIYENKYMKKKMKSILYSGT